jgi:hypothetical protein
VDQENNPLHEVPLQLTARGCFQFEFDKQLCIFQTEMFETYNIKNKRSMCVFAPRFKSIMCGKGIRQSKACITTDYETPSGFSSNFVGDREDFASKFWFDAPESLTYAQYVNNLYLDTKSSCELKGWWSLKTA